MPPVSKPAVELGFAIAPLAWRLAARGYAPRTCFGGNFGCDLGRFSALDPNAGEEEDIRIHIARRYAAALIGSWPENNELTHRFRLRQVSPPRSMSRKS